MAKTDELELDPNAKASGGKGKMIIIIVLVVLLVAGGTIAGLYFSGMLGGAKSDAKDEQAEEEKALEVKPAFYFDMQPPFIVNFEDQTYAGYLQIEMQAMSHDQKVITELTTHMPVIRNNILLLLGSQKYEVVKTRKGKEDLQAKVLETIQSIVGEATRAAMEKESEAKVKDEDVPNVEQVYFTSFIMQ